VVAKLILPTNVDLGKKGELQDGLFDHQLALDKEINQTSASEEEDANRAAEKVYKRLDAITTGLAGCKKIVLLFDECHRLLQEHFGLEAFLFRCIRVWLREERHDGQRVVAVFAGATSSKGLLRLECPSWLTEDTVPKVVVLTPHFIRRRQLGPVLRYCLKMMA